ncbi:MULTISPECIES: class I SAM-dependent methyltransferase [Methylobacterium]|uniref:class I SAM-dependent methyltransferase n=1 Tax=Methylobacterium TaxID=407 RepID=UPI0008E5E31B|nr:MULTISPECIES: class I SAM-dependent methyltransferase [Methylobacterium]MBZ6413366.1 class I SAM-dependent methyltransferase [Methylobacterium sp.]MBK3397853.1 class I SAM-dependent methyltransferase [Methylobacterium ajmalii]MBK3409975.1 class I SAM-dependent methyltransferase [Methylobacterium ajmalii]MBK3423969.1 class I SAM-dependent methyltransferase [Methylobacterium ajmalii]SFE82699.1 Methyltransferase domain-containing protein [Methylobacterium sp. yr596]
MVSSWREFWDRDTPIYVSARHKARHYAGLADEIAAMVPHPGAVVLDHGCGEALFADRIAEACGRLLLCDASPRRRDALARRFAGSPRIAVLAPEDVAALPAASLDLVVANSLAQYLTDAELAACLRDWRRALKPGGRLVLADVIPPQLGAAADATALLAFARREGFLAAALLGLVRTVLSDYRSLRRRLGLTRYDEAAMLARLHEAGFTAERMPRNLGHNQGRMAFTARA